ncbi:hypothetical protein Kpol_223p3 [Vanderwaltozyma polyspora DSM 70294]|uniref:Structure-specific endonuclease subunit SLX1 n=1 Tax=Vanderwaltozyma polyspora (strain ATCC 22028 / DSM 70294 / BCRC 21397 / CBS 2163 / NBRC 10782 / NRRL Y-8283 / UCD 57-17) TaxID=436907 RepID=SLX1_VANPO|nr:uncharacterized protein Kpol_223p3 [Vanderwaltozyma polyspora DSM 70294]A7TTE6.1 RecName: Full=Structure-specific endonuclease subunit SLX1 [Vanderwaltozyma polyspora DSM 70294]EDO14460.1 hypothetical protein Kpol_223p3 [Vanderwaltozyma polyspora DSM 70294]
MMNSSQFSDSQTTSLHRIPTFYCCYLLQSINKKQSFYIGSTPNPVRRLRQHNGNLSNGGAYRTKREGTRPWEMVLVVYGFTSKIAALQFEHAWQHGYKTHYIPMDDRIMKNANSGRTVHHKLGLVRQLLANVYFRHMNLKVHFFSMPILDVWNLNKFNIKMGSNEISVDVSQVSQETKTNLEQASDDDDDNGACSRDERNLQLVTELYDNTVTKENEIKEIIKDILVLGERNCNLCGQCYDYTSEDDTMKMHIFICPNSTCHYEAHLNCLYEKFIEEESGIDSKNILLPNFCMCPGCLDEMSWSDFVKISTMIKNSFSN